jgi:5-formaminoimidazole-4-carboxamide-1-beta-D-ribofuranosyl 5'-monophosphate synthetase
MEKENKRGKMWFLTSDKIDLQKVVEVIKEEREKEKEEKEKRKIQCWVCGKEGSLSIVHIKKYTYVYCVHSKYEKCCLGNLGKIFVDLLFAIKKQQEGKEQEKGGENK